MKVITKERIINNCLICWQPVESHKKTVRYCPKHRKVYTEMQKQAAKRYLKKKAERMSKPVSEIHCPACGYYCLGKGGFGCIDKPWLVAHAKPAPRGNKEDDGNKS